MSTAEGTVKICDANMWGTVCGTLWTTNDAKVICNQLKYTSGKYWNYEYYYFYFRCCCCYHIQQVLHSTIPSLGLEMLPLLGTILVDVEAPRVP